MAGSLVPVMVAPLPAVFYEDPIRVLKALLQFGGDPSDGMAMALNVPLSVGVTAAVYALDPVPFVLKVCSLPSWLGNLAGSYGTVPVLPLSSTSYKLEVDNRVQAACSLLPITDPIFHAPIKKAKQGHMHLLFWRFATMHYNSSGRFHVLGLLTSSGFLPIWEFAKTPSAKQAYNRLVDLLRARFYSLVGVGY